MSPQQPRSIKPGHISTVPSWQVNKHAPPEYEPDGLCHCTEPTAVSGIGECQTCHRLVVKR